LKRSSSLAVGFLVSACGGPASPAEQTMSPNNVSEVRLVEERLDQLDCGPLDGSSSFAEVCKSFTGVDLFVLQTRSGCVVSPAALPADWTGGEPVRQCMPDLIWRMDSEKPVALAYRISQYDDDPVSIDRGYYRGNWILSTVAVGEQSVCATHSIQGIGAKDVVLKELHELVLPHRCEDSLIYIDVN